MGSRLVQWQGYDALLTCLIHDPKPLTAKHWKQFTQRKKELKPPLLLLWPLKAESPSCIWGRVFCDPDGNAETTKEYHSLTTQMNLFYHDVTRDLSKLKPVKLEQGLVTSRMYPISLGGCLQPTVMELMCVLLYFPCRCAWCIVRRWSLGVGPWWRPLSWTLSPAGLTASWWTTESMFLSPQTSKTCRPVAERNGVIVIMSWLCLVCRLFSCQFIPGIE